MTRVRLRRALISVSDKTGVVELARRLADLGVHLMSTGGTRALLAKQGLEVEEVAAYTGFPEMMDGRVKTLHPLIHGGLLGRRNGQEPDDSQEMAAQGIEGIDLLVVNLYPFAAAIREHPDDLANAIENIDIGGPAMLRSAAKNFRSVAVASDPADYGPLIEALESGDGALDERARFQMAVKTFERVAQYDADIANYLSAHDLESGERDAHPGTLTVQYRRKQRMRYGENPHQGAAFYTEASPSGMSVASATQLQGKELSYNNVADADAALECVQAFDAPACVIVKHANPCGVAEAADPLAAYEGAFRTDPTSAFGGIIAFNREVDADVASKITANQFVEVVIAPGVTEAAQSAFATKGNVRVLVAEGDATAMTGLDYKKVAGGLLVQDKDAALLDDGGLRVVTKRAPTEAEHGDLVFAWKVAKFVKSNAIVYARDSMTVGIGAGQMARVHSARVAGIKAAEAGIEVGGAVMASDAFFPFRDGIDAAAAEGIVAVIQPGGSVRDQEVIDAANEAGIAMVFTGMRHFRH